MEKTILASMALVVGLGVSSASTAQSVFVSAEMDGTWDPLIIAPTGTTLTAHIYADIDDTHGGLIGWGVEAPYANSTLQDPCCEFDPFFNLPATPDTSTLGVVNMTAGRIGVGGVSGSAIYLGNYSVVMDSENSWILLLDNIFPNDPNFDGFVAADGFVYDDTIDFLQSQVNVPIPAAAWLFGSGLLGLIGIARKKAA